MINLEEVSWYQDGITKRYVQENAEDLAEPEKLKPAELATAITYCTEVKNPFADELVNRSSSGQTKIKYRNAPYPAMVKEAVAAAAREFGITII